MSQWTLQNLSLNIPSFLCKTRLIKTADRSQVWQKTTVELKSNSNQLFASTPACFIKEPRKCFQIPKATQEIQLHFFPDHSHSWNITDTLNSTCHPQHKHFPLMFLLPSISLWGSEGREQECSNLQMRRLYCQACIPVLTQNLKLLQSTAKAEKHWFRWFILSLQVQLSSP